MHALMGYADFVMDVLSIIQLGQHGQQGLMGLNVAYPGAAAGPHGESAAV